MTLLAPTHSPMLDEVCQLTAETFNCALRLSPSACW